MAPGPLIEEFLSGHACIAFRKIQNVSMALDLEHDKARNVIFVKFYNYTGRWSSIMKTVHYGA